MDSSYWLISISDAAHEYVSRLEATGAGESSAERFVQNIYSKFMHKSDFGHLVFFHFLVMSLIAIMSRK